MLRHLSVRDFVIVEALEVDLASGFSALTGETGAGKSILIDALQLALGSRGDAGIVREGASRAEIGVAFDTPASLLGWLDDGGFDPAETLLLRRTIDAQGKSRAWINGRLATIGQLREAAEHLVDIHGQHAWQSLTRSASVRALLDSFAGVRADVLATRWSAWKAAADALAAAGSARDGVLREAERLAWQIGELEKLAPAEGEWDELDAEHRRLSNRQALIDAAREALDALSEADANASSLAGRATHALEQVAGFDLRLAEVIEVLEGAQAQLQDAAHTLSGYLHDADPDPQRLETLDARLSAWMGLARRHRRPPAELPALLAQWQDERRELDAASDLDALAAAEANALLAFRHEAARVSAARAAAAPRLAAAVTQAMQQLGMGGGRFEVVLLPQDAPQSFGAESAEFRVAGHAGSTPRPLAKVASGGELSRIALAISVTTASATTASATTASVTTASAAPTGEVLATASDTPASFGGAPEIADAGAGTLIFDEIDAGVGGAVAETVGRLMKQLGRDRQVLAVTHLPQVAACADHHFVVAKRARDGRTSSAVETIAGELRVAEIARMLGGERLSGTSLAHAQEMLAGGALETAGADDVVERAAGLAGDQAIDHAADGAANETADRAADTTATEAPTTRRPSRRPV